MSYEEYIKDLDHEDLQNLIKMCNAKMQKIEEAGKVPLYIVSCDCINHFAHTDEAVAKAWLGNVIRLLVNKDQFDDISELRLRKKMIFKSELKDWDGFNTPPHECVLLDKRL